jgi:hypothetical protein
MTQIMVDFINYIKQETLTRELVKRIPEEGFFTENYKIEGYEILLGVRKETD